MSWQKQARCAESDPDLFVGDVPDERAAKAICARCEVAAECLTFALESYSRHGVWGGTTELERRDISKRRHIPIAPKQYRAGSPGPRKAS